MSTALASALLRWTLPGLVLRMAAATLRIRSLLRPRTTVRLARPLLPLRLGGMALRIRHGPGRFRL